MKAYNDFSGVSDGSQMTVANSGGTGLTPFDTVSAATSGAGLQSSSAHTIRGRRMLSDFTGATAVANTYGWNANVLGAPGTIWYQEYFYFSALPSGNVNLARWTSGGTGATSVSVATLILLTTGLLRITGTAGTVITTATAIPVGSVFRVQCKITSSGTVGQAEIRVFSGANVESATPSQSVTSTATQNMGSGLIDTVRFGNTGALANLGPFWAADVEINNTGYPAALGAAIFPLANAGPDQSVDPEDPVQLAGSGTDADGTVVGYKWTQTAGPTTPLSSTTDPAPTFEAPAVTGGARLTFSLVVTDNSGLASAPDTVNIDVAPTNPVGEPRRLYNNFANLADQETLTTLNSGGPDSNAFDIVTVGAGSTMKITGDHLIRNRRSLKVASGPTTAEANTFGWNENEFSPENPELYVQGYFYVEALPTANLTFIRLTSSGTTISCGSLVLFTTGAIRASDGAGAAMATSATGLIVPGWSRVQFHLVSSASNGHCEVRIFSGADLEKSTPTVTLISAFGFNTGPGIVDTIRFGMTNPTTGQTIYFQDLEVRTTEWPEALGTFSAPSVSAGPDQVDVEPNTDVTLAGTFTGLGAGLTIGSYVWEQLSGPTATLAGTGATRTFTAPGSLGGETLQFQFSVIDSAGHRSNLSRTAIKVLASTEFVLLNGDWVPLPSTVL